MPMSYKLPRSAGGWYAILASLKMFWQSGAVLPLFKSLFTKNACKSCALGMGGQKGGLRDERGSFPSVCSKSIQAQASDMQGAVPADFFDRYAIATLKNRSPLELEKCGRLTRPMLCEPGDVRYRFISWDEALDLLVEKLKSTTPDRAFFYASGRSSNEAGFVLQLFARAFGSNNVNNCSYYCHQASGVGLSQSLGTGTATIELEDLSGADLIFLLGANPSSNHPRFMRVLMDVRRRGGHVVVVNPARERGLENFSVPSDWRSLLFGSEIASVYVQPHIGGDIAVCKGVAKGLFAMSEPPRVDRNFIENCTEHFDEYKRDIDNTSWETIEKSSGVSREELRKLAGIYAQSRNAVFAWAMGITHHAHGVENVQSIANLALLRGMVGRKYAGLLPLRGHSNVQGIGSVGVAPQPRKAFLDNLESLYQIKLPAVKGLDTLGCMEAADAGGFDFAWNLGGNLYGSNPDASFAERALSKIGFVLYMNTTLNQGHFRGMGRTTLVLPVLARDEEPEPTTQESMFNYVRLSDGGPARHPGPRSEASVIVEAARRLFPRGPIPWDELKTSAGIRGAIGAAAPGFKQILQIDKTRREFHIEGRVLHRPAFATPTGRASFKAVEVPPGPLEKGGPNRFKLMTVRSDSQFNTVVYELHDKYRGVDSRDVVLMNPEDMRRLGLVENALVTVRNATGMLTGQKLAPYPVKAGNIMMYFPESNILVPRISDGQSKTPSFKSVDVFVEREDWRG